MFIIIVIAIILWSKMNLQRWKAAQLGEELKRQIGLSQEETAGDKALKQETAEQVFGN